MSSLHPRDGGGGIEVTIRIGGGDDEVTRAVVVDEPELRFIREAYETQENFRVRVRTAASGRCVCWGGLPDMLE